MTTQGAYRHLALYDLAGSFSYACFAELTVLQMLYEKSMIDFLKQTGDIQAINEIIKVIPKPYLCHLQSLAKAIAAFEERERVTNKDSIRVCYFYNTIITSSFQGST